MSSLLGPELPFLKGFLFSLKLLQEMFEYITDNNLSTANN